MLRDGTLQAEEDGFRDEDGRFLSERALNHVVYDHPAFNSDRELDQFCRDYCEDEYRSMCFICPSQNSEGAVEHSVVLFTGLDRVDTDVMLLISRNADPGPRMEQLGPCYFQSPDITQLHVVVDDDVRDHLCQSIHRPPPVEWFIVWFNSRRPIHTLSKQEALHDDRHL